MASFKTACGGRIRVGTDKFDEIERWPQDHAALERSIHRIKLPVDGSTFFIKEVVFDSNIGVTNCVSATSENPMLFAFRNKKRRASRVVVNTFKVPTKSFTIIATKNVENGSWWLVDYYFGERAPREPNDPYFQKLGFDPEELETSRAFWETHALVHSPFKMGECFVSTWEEQAPVLKELSRI